MNLDYIPLLQVQRKLHDIPRGQARFRQYLRTIFNDDELGTLLPLVAMNPMARDHVTFLLDQLLAMDADAVGAQAAGEASNSLHDIPGTFKVALVVADDRMGAWTNRYASEFDLRFGAGPGRLQAGDQPRLPKWLKHWWLFGVLWSSEPPSVRTAREVILAAAHRAAYVHRKGPARTLREMLAQEGEVMMRAGCDVPCLDEEDIHYTRQVLAPYLDETDKRLWMEYLFGDEPGRTLGFTPRGLSPWAGLALALRDAQQERMMRSKGQITSV